MIHHSDFAIIATIIVIIIIIWTLIKLRGGRSYGVKDCSTGRCSKSCIVPIGYKYDPTKGTQLVSNGFKGGCELPLQLLGSTFNGTMYNWNSTRRGSRKWSITQLDGLSNAITSITWGPDRNDGIGLANKSTVEQCTGFGTILNLNNPKDYSAGWETGIIYMSDKSVRDVLKYTKYIFIHIFKVDLDKDNNPSKLRMWEAMVDDEQKSYLYINQLKNNIGAVELFGAGGQYKTNTTSDLYVPKTSKNAIYYLEMNYDLSRGIDIPDPSRWVAGSLHYHDLSLGTPPQ